MENGTDTGKVGSGKVDIGNGREIIRSGAGTKELQYHFCFDPYQCFSFEISVKLLIIKQAK